ncbi:MAG: restriction endonuclease subunit S [Giesbergeria sp.]|uniref:restriction endonuclease subunit S n=1 Tax=Giesbergeria sp. TaxID=2818473 RepID=UPI0026124F60|nr:restriction endonuclease subunit S [Giesbergeria sp.]MDD2610954.1 restriction endonuclease subunit S [Giesbergeria sp.]
MSEEQIKPGYKRTEVGMIPEEWRVETIGSIFYLKQGVQTPVELQSAIKKEDYIRFIRIVDLTDPSISWRYIKNPGKDHHISSNDLFMVRYGSPGLLGLGFSGVIANNLFRLIPKKEISVNFYYQYIKNKKAEIVEISGSSTMPAVNFGTLSALAVLSPPLAEQRAIAAALSDVDALLAQLDQLIAKKRDLKQATMQQLLTGQTRLPGFSGAWQVKRLGDVGSCLRGVTYKGDNDLSPHDTSYTKRLLRSNNVQSATVVLDEVQFVNSRCVSVQQILQKDDILICMANGSKSLVGKAGIFNVADGHEYTYGAFMACFRTEATTFNSSFVFYLFQTGKYKNYINNLLAGSSINNLNPSSIESLEFNIPQIAEQTAIATILSNMDAELATLQARRDKTHALKQGMMQELLTGRIRLV